MSGPGDGEVTGVDQMPVYRVEDLGRAEVFQLLRAAQCVLAVDAVTGGILPVFGGPVWRQVRLGRGREFGKGAVLAFNIWPGTVDLDVLSIAVRMAKLGR